jgi:hypothetical protein
VEGTGVVSEGGDGAAAGLGFAGGAPAGLGPGPAIGGCLTVV